MLKDIKVTQNDNRTNYERIAYAIDHIKKNFKEQPSLEAIAKEIHVSPFHFQRLFTDWAGVSPKKFTQYLSVGYAKNLLRNEKLSLLGTAEETGLSSTGRLHDLFVNIEGMTPGEYKRGGESLAINYCFAESPFGKIILASTPKGVCHIAFKEDETIALAELKQRFPNANYHQVVDKYQQDALYIFQQDWSHLDQIKLHLKGSQFQLKVWETLLKIPMGGLSSYGEIAKAVGSPKASRAVGTAVGNNPVAYLIPCHRVIQATGGLGGYMWGETRKSAMIGWEAAKMGAQA